MLHQTLKNKGRRGCGRVARSPRQSGFDVGVERGTVSEVTEVTEARGGRGVS